jgi:hypothetical protein
LQNGQREWIASLGGPLILLSSEFLPDWNGTFIYDADDEDFIGSASGTDYERAGQVDDYVGVVPVGDGQGLILGDAPLQTCWWPLPPIGGMFVRWRYSDSKENIERYFSLLHEGDWETTSCTLTVGEHPLYLFDSASMGTELDESLVIQLPAGTYVIDTCDKKFNAATALLFHRLRRR